MMFETVEEKSRGIRNDFDLATVMTDECRLPDKNGWQRTGTLSFMALDLLEYSEGEIKRWYRHDLESGAWCLAYQMIFADAERQDRYTNSIEDVYRSKISVIYDFKMRMVKDEWRPPYFFIKKWLSYWSDFHKELNNQTANLIPEPGILARESEIREELIRRKWTKNSSGLRCMRRRIAV